MAKTNKPIISTGASNIQEIKRAIKIIEKKGNKKIIILHCILNYPTENSNANLRMIIDLKKKFKNYYIGYSDHTLPSENMEALFTSYILGAKVIEKHFTHNKSLKGNDHYHAMDYKDLIKFKNLILNYNELLGKEKKNVLKVS